MLRISGVIRWKVCQAFVIVQRNCLETQIYILLLNSTSWNVKNIIHDQRHQKTKSYQATKVDRRGIQSQFKESAPFRETKPLYTFVNKQNNERKTGERRRRVKSGTNTDTDTNLRTRSKTWLRTRGYKGSEVLVSLSLQSCDDSLRFWPGQMRGHYPSETTISYQSSFQTSIGYLQALRRELSCSHCTKLSRLYLAVEIYCN